MPRGRKAETLLSEIRRWVIGGDGFGSAATGHSHLAENGTIDCQECAAAHGLPEAPAEAQPPVRAEDTEEPTAPAAAE